jgi:hypothetical protein
VLGVTGFVLHGLWIGLGLGICCSVWVTLVFWMAMRHEQAWTWPTITPDTTIVSYARECWALLPPSMAHILPFGVAASVITGLAMAILWPRLTTALKWSLTGLTMALFGALVACNYGRPDLLTYLPRQPRCRWRSSRAAGSRRWDPMEDRPTRGGAQDQARRAGAGERAARSFHDRPRVNP